MLNLSVEVHNPTTRIFVVTAHSQKKGERPMQEFFVLTNSNAASFFSDTDTQFVKAKTAKEAAEKARKSYKHPAGLFALNVYANSDAYLKGRKPLVRWLSKRADIRMNGIKCPHCGGKTKLSVANTGKNGTTDIHTCKKCEKDVEVEMSAT